MRTAPRALVGQEPEEDVLGADVPVAERMGLANASLEDALGGAREAAPPLGGARRLERRDALADRVRGQARFGEHRGRRLVLRQGEAEEEVLRPDALVPEARGLLLREDDHLPRAAREAGERPVEAPARALAGRAPFVALDDLVDALVADSQALGDLAERAALGVEATDRVAVVGPGALELVLRLEHPVA